MNAPSGVTEISGGVVLCQDAHALSERRARIMIGRVCRDYLDENILIPIELLHHSGHAKLLNGSDTLCAALVQKAAVAQAQATNTAVRDKVKKLFAITTAAITQVEAFEKRLPATPLTHRLLTQLSGSDPLYGGRIAFSALAHHLHMSKHWTEKADRCLAGGDREHQKRENLAHEIAEKGGEGDKIDVDGQKDQLDRHEYDDDVLAVEKYAEDADGEQNGGKRQIVAKPDGHHSPVLDPLPRADFANLDGGLRPPRHLG